jgi:hypothetical protein
VGRDAVALRRPLGMQEEAGVHVGVALRDRAAVGEREPGQEGPDDLLGGGERTLDVDPGRDAEALEGSDEDLGGGVARAGVAA